MSYYGKRKYRGPIVPMRVICVNNYIVIIVEIIEIILVIKTLLFPLFIYSRGNVLKSEKIAGYTEYK